MYVGYAGFPDGKLPPAGRLFLEQFEEARPGLRTPDLSAAYAEHATEILLDAIARSNGTRPSVTRELRRTRIEGGILGDIRFDRERRPRRGTGDHLPCGRQGSDRRSRDHGPVSLAPLSGGTDPAARRNRSAT